MSEQFIYRYDIEAFQQRVPTDHGELFIDFAPSEQDMEGWRRSSEEIILQGEGRLLRRSVWNHPESTQRRILVDVVECSSAAEAIASLMDSLEGNQLAELPEGPNELGMLSFVHPEGVPPAVFFARGNLGISIMSFAPEAVEVVPWAQRLNRRLDEQPPLERQSLSLEARQSRAKTGESVTVTYDLPWKIAEGGYLKFVVRGGIIAHKDGKLVITASRSGELQLEARVIEPGRVTEGGQLSLTVD
jgi:hypothetical protein